MTMQSTPEENMNTIPDAIKQLIAQGSHYKNFEPNWEIRTSFERHKTKIRKWRNLVGEAKFDLQKEFWPFINWNMPEYWNESSNFYRIVRHIFKIKLPEIIPIDVHYRLIGNCEWSFERFEIRRDEQMPIVSSGKYYDFPVVLALAYNLSKPRRRNVIIEEIPGELNENAKLRKFKDILTEEEWDRLYGGMGWGYCG